MQEFKEIAEIAKFTSSQVSSYEDSLKYYRDLKNSLDTARDEGKEEGKIEFAQRAFMKGLSVEDIMDLTGLSQEQVESLK